MARKAEAVTPEQRGALPDAVRVKAGYSFFYGQVLKVLAREAGYWFLANPQTGRSMRFLDREVSEHD